MATSIGFMFHPEEGLCLLRNDLVDYLLENAEECPEGFARELLEQIAARIALIGVDMETP
jgi:hypothetical protein